MIIKRDIYEDLKDHLEKKEITLLIGPRQVGKTTLLLELEKEMRKKGKKTVFFNLDLEEDRYFFGSQRQLVKKIELELGKERGYVFVDEIQRKENAGLFLKGIYDRLLPYKLIVSGSGSLELKEKIYESLVGRKRVFELTPITFEEFVDFKTNYQYENRLTEFFKIEKEKTSEFLLEYLNFGGYPRVILEETIEEKRKTIDEIYQSYLLKDISFLLQLKKTENFTDLLKTLSWQVGQLVNYSEISSTIGISFPTLKQYLYYLEKTFIVTKMPPFFKRIKKELVKTPIFYFVDLGLSNYASGRFGNLIRPQDLSFVFQNFIFNLLKEKIRWINGRICFWRSKSGGEVDFVSDFFQKQIPFEVKYQALKDLKIPRGLRSFINKYQPEKAIIINLNLEEKIKVEKTTVWFMPWWRMIKGEVFF